MDRRYLEEVSLTPDEQAIAEIALKKSMLLSEKYLTRHSKHGEMRLPVDIARSAAVISPLTPAVSPALSEIRPAGIIMNQSMTVL